MVRQTYRSLRAPARSWAGVSFGVSQPFVLYNYKGGLRLADLPGLATGSIPVVVAGLAAFLVLVIVRKLLTNLGYRKEESLMIENYETESSVLEVFSAVGTGYLAGGLPS